MTALSDVSQLREVYRPPSGRAVKKELDHLDVHCRNFIALSPFLVMATSGSDGSADASPRGGPPGFVKVLGENRLAFGDSPGNNRLDSLSNLVANPAVGLLFMVPGINETLRVNGSVEISTDAELCERLAIEGRPPASALVVDVDAAYLHCAKALMRSRLWDPAAQVDRTELPTMGEMIKDHTGSTEPAETQEEMEARYREILY